MIEFLDAVNLWAHRIGLLLFVSLMIVLGVVLLYRGYRDR